MIENINLERANVSAELHAFMYDYLYGYEGVFNYGQKLAFEIVSNNQIKLYDGLICNKGRFMRIVTGSYETVTIENGTSGVNRTDLIVAHFESDGIVETHDIRVLKGTSEAIPTHTTGSTHEGASVHEMPLYAVRLEGLTITSVTPMFDVLHSLNTIRNNISNPNLLINGDFKIWQRGETFSSVVKNGYTADRWRNPILNTQNLNVEKVDDGMKLTTTDSRTVIAQFVEGRLLNEDYTLSLSVDGIKFTTTFNVADTTWTTKDLYHDGEKLVVVAFQVQTGNYTNVEIYIQKTEAVLNWVKLERGSIATPFVPRMYVEELPMCQRYCYALDGSHGMSSVYQNTSVTIIPLPTTMRTTPTVSYAEAKAIIDGVGEYAIGSTNTITLKPNMLQIIFKTKESTGTTLRVGRTSATNMVIDAEIY